MQQLHFFEEFNLEKCAQGYFLSKFYAFWNTEVLEELSISCLDEYEMSDFALRTSCFPFKPQKLTLETCSHTVDMFLFLIDRLNMLNQLSGGEAMKLRLLMSVRVHPWSFLICLPSEPSVSYSEFLIKKCSSFFVEIIFGIHPPQSVLKSVGVKISRGSQWVLVGASGCLCVPVGPHESLWVFKFLN